MFRSLPVILLVLLQLSTFSGQKVPGPTCRTKNPTRPASFFRGAINPGHNLWGTAGNRVVPYQFHKDNTLETDKPVFRDAMEYIESVSCVRFEERDGQSSYLEFDRACANDGSPLNPGFKRIDCFGGSYVTPITGAGRGRVELTTSTPLKKGHFWQRGHITHELLHVLGTEHTQNRRDRDDYIKIDWSKISKEWQPQYNKCYFCDRKKIKYDCMSIMHYRTYGEMVAHNPETCDLESIARWLRWSDIDLLNDNYQCGQPIPLVSGAGVLKSHASYPRGKYENNDYWIEYLVVATGNTIEFTFVDEFELEGAKWRGKCKDSVEIVDGDGKDLLSRACGSERPARVVSRTNRAYVAFVSNGRRTGKGFKLHWREIKGENPPISTLPLNGILTSPEYPNKYKNYINKTYPILVEEGKVVEIEFTKFEVEYEQSCEYDWLKITESNGATILDKSCGDTKPTSPLLSKTNSVNVIFWTDHSKTYNGWSLNWRAVSYITSPNYPKKYDNDLKDEVYLIEAIGHEGKLELIFVDFEIEIYKGNCVDSVEIIDGDGKTLMGKTCGSERPGKILSNTNKVNVIFNTDYSVGKRGFQLEWKVAKE